MAEVVNATVMSFSNLTNPELKLNKASVVSYILPVICLTIFLGNLLVLLTIKRFRVHRVPDLLIGALALVDLVNDIGPVLISTVIHLIEPQGFKALGIHPLCEFYNWAASFLRLLACFITTVMSLDRLCAILWPLFYRTKVTLSAAVYTLLSISLSAAFVASWPAMGWGEVFPHLGICSFDFGGGYACVIAILGYVQLGIVFSCFVGVAHTLRKFQRRLDALKSGQTMVLKSGHVEVQQCQPSCASVKPNPPAESRHSKESRLFVKIMGIVVLLFYISWMPIIFSITMELITQRQNDNLQSLSAQMSIFGSLVNPLVYCVMCAPYRRGYIYVIRKVFCACSCAESERDSYNIPTTAAVAPSIQGQHR